MTVFSDDFSGDLSQWDNVPEGWSIENGKLKSTSISSITKNISIHSDLTLTIKLKQPQPGIQQIKFYNADKSRYMILSLKYDGTHFMGEFINYPDHEDGYSWFTYDVSTELEIVIHRVTDVNGITWDYYLNGSLWGWNKYSWMNDVIESISLENKGWEGNPTTVYWDDLNVTYTPLSYSTVNFKNVIRVQKFERVSFKNVIRVLTVRTVNFKNVIHVRAIWIYSLVVQGNVLIDSPMSAPRPDENIILEVGNAEYESIGQWNTTQRGNDATSTFSVSISSSKDLPIVTGQKIRLKENFGDPEGFYNGEIQDVDDNIVSGKRIYTITGRDFANPLVTQPFSISADTDNPVTFNSNQVLDWILMGTNIKKGDCADITVGGITNQNNVFNGFAGNWNTKAEALTALLALVSTQTGKNVSWFINSKGLLRIFYTNIIDPSIGIFIFNNNPRVKLKNPKENSENIINKQKGTGGANNELVSELEDSESINGWTDLNTGISWPGYGVKQGADFQDSSILTQNDLDKKVQNILNLHSKPIFTTKLIFSHLPQVEIGQPCYLVEHYKCKGMPFVVTDIERNGDTGNRNTTVTVTTDPTTLGPLSNYEATKVTAKQEVIAKLPFKAHVTQITDDVLTVKPVNQEGAVNTTRLGC